MTTVQTQAWDIAKLAKVNSLKSHIKYTIINGQVTCNIAVLATFVLTF